MSTAYFIVLEDESLGIDTFVNGKFIAQSFDELNVFCKTHQLKTVEDYFSQDASEFMDEIEGMEDFNIPAQDIQWFEAQEGIDWCQTLIKKLNNEPSNLNVELIVEDLDEYASVFKRIKTHDIKWHFELDY